MQTIPPHYFDELSEPLQHLLQTQSLAVLCTSTGQALVDRLTQAPENAHQLLAAVLAFPSDLTQSLLQSKDETLRKLLILLASALFNVRIQMEAGSQQASQVAKKIDQRLTQVAPTLPIQLLNELLDATGEAELPISEAIVNIARDRFDENFAGTAKANERPLADAIPSPEAMVQELLSALPETAPYYEIYTMLSQFFGNRLPADALQLLMLALLMGRNEKVQAAALLFLLHPDKTQRRQAAKGLEMAYPQLQFSDTNLSRLYQIVYWLPAAERQALASTLSLTLNLPPAKPAIPRSVQRAQGNFCDGAGCFASILLIQNATTTQVINILCKERVGIKDAIIVSDFADLTEGEAMFEELVASLTDQGLGTGAVSTQALLPQWEHFIAVGHCQDKVPPPALVAVAEMMTPTYWMPEALNSGTLAKRFLSGYLPEDKAAARERSTAWVSPMHEMGLWSWFETNDTLHKLTARAKREQWSAKRLSEQILATIILPERARWLDRFLLCSLLLEHREDDESPMQALSDFAVLIESALLDSTFVAHPLMHRIANLSAQSSQERARVEGGVLDVL